MMHKNPIYKKILALAAAAALALSLAACGGQETSEGPSEASGYIYVPEFVDLSSGEESLDMSSPKLLGTELYYYSYYWDEETEVGGYKFYRRSVETNETVELPLSFDLGEYDNYYPMGSVIFDREGNLFCLIDASVSDEESYHEDYYLFKFDQEGNLLAKVDITEALSSGEDDSAYVQRAVVDSQGKIYAVLSGTGNSYVVAIDAEGNTLAKIDCNADWVSSIGVTQDDTVLISRYSNTSSGMEVVEVDVAGKALGRVHSNMPSSYNSDSLNPTADGGLLVNDGSKLWKYDLETETSEEILTWTDCNINGNYISMIEIMEDGRIAVLSENWSDGTKEIAFLTQEDASQVAQKQILTIATLDSSQSLQEAVVNFNKQSDTYQVRIETYYDANSEWTETKYQDAITALNNAITGSNCPDIIDLSYGNPSAYVSKGLLVDLAPYLDSSSTVKREDLVEAVLEAYTYGDTLICIPDSFTMSTVMGRTSQLGDRSGWTVKEMMAFYEEHPDAELLNYATKSSILSLCLQYSSDAFIDYSTGKCSFDSQEFLDILEFANMFPKENEYSEEDESMPKKLSSGKLLLYSTSVYSMEEFQMNSLMFNEPITFIGYPTVDGSSGNYINGSNCYAITTKSSSPDGAWAFIESLLQYEPQPQWGGMDNFSIRKDMLEESFAKAMEENMATDEDGNPVLDADGNPEVYPKSTWGWDDWEAEIYAATPEQVQQIRDLMNNSKAAVNSDQTILSMILEEASPYFEGQKSAQEVAGVIQSRVQVYINENS
ncbi:MAG: extracellular solute-binding protein [Lachnospiraceae bacterium]|nr:extracellular solute-binding protein [Lachnospiraceae bacterium]